MEGCEVFGLISIFLMDLRMDLLWKILLLALSPTQVMAGVGWIGWLGFGPVWLGWLGWLVLGLLEDASSTSELS